LGKKAKYGEEVRTFFRETVENPKPGGVQKTRKKKKKAGGGKGKLPGGPEGGEIVSGRKNPLAYV